MGNSPTLAKSPPKEGGTTPNYLCEDSTGTGTNCRERANGTDPLHV